MARLSAHGTEIGRLEFSDYRKAYMADGKILKDRGHGWKLWGKCKPGVTPEAAYENAKRKQAEKLSARPALAAYVDYVRSLAPLSKRWKLTLALSMMPDDPDGIYSDCCDSYGDNVEADLDDICKLCDLYRAACEEGQPATEPA